jgi:preprotein translocase subunit YajC
VVAKAYSIAIFRATFQITGQRAAFPEYLMFISDALAQATGAPTTGVDLFGMIVPLIAIMVVFYFLLIRPQQKKMKEHQDMLSKVSKGDTVVTNGGLIGKVVRVVDDSTLLVEVGENVKVNVLRAGVSDIRTKGEPKK